MKTNTIIASLFNSFYSVDVMSAYFTMSLGKTQTAAAATARVSGIVRLVLSDVPRPAQRIMACFLPFGLRPMSF